MKEFNSKELEVGSAGEELEGIDMKIDEKGMRFVFDIMFNQMYRDPIGSVIREITSNCFDSHIEAGVDDPVVIEFGEDEAGEYISFKDVGVGISPERMQKVYSKPTSSTKRDTQDQLGYWGLGSKSPLAYDDFFYLTTVFDKIEYQYVIHKGTSAPRIEKILETETEEPNGSVVKVYFKSKIDRVLFIEKLNYQLRYFDNVYVTGIHYNNEYKIYEKKTFKYRNDTPADENLHLCIGKVTYPIDWRLLGTPPISLPFGLKFAIGELPVTPERESVKYVIIENPDGTTIDVKEIIKAKINEFKEELNELAGEINYDHNNLQDYWEHRNDKPYITLGTNKIKVNAYVQGRKHVYTPLAQYGISVPSNPMFVFRVVAEVGTWAGAKVTKVDSYNRALDFDNFNDYFIVRQFKPVSKYKTMHVDYVKELARKAGKRTVVFVNDNREAYVEIMRSTQGTYRRKNFRTVDFPLPPVKTVDYSKYNKGMLWRYYKKVMLTELILCSIDFMQLDIPQDWVQEWERKNYNPNKLTADEGEIIAENVRNSYKSTRRRVYDIDELKTAKGFIVYGFTADEQLLENWAIFFSSGLYYADAQVLKIRQRDEKHLIALKHSVYVRSLMSDNVIFKKVATAIVLNESKIWDKGFIRLGVTGRQSLTDSPIMEKVFTPVVKKMKELSTIAKTTVHISSDETKEFQKEIVAIAKQNNWLDKESVEGLEKVEKYFEGLPLLDFVVELEAATPYVAEYARMCGKPVNQEWVKLENWQEEVIKESRAKLVYAAEVNFDLQKTNNYPYDPWRKESISTIKNRYKATLEKMQNNLFDLLPLIQYHDSKKAIANHA